MDQHSTPAHICCEFKICYIICIIAVLYGIWCYILDLVIQAHLLISVVSSKSAILYASLLCCMEYDVIYWTLWFKRTCSYLLWVQNLLYYMHHCCAVWNMMLYIGPCDSSAPAHICCEFKICYIICIIAVLYGIWCYILDLVIQAHLLISVVSSKSAILYASLLCCMEYDVIYWTLWFKRTCSYLLWVQNLLYYMHHCCAVWNMMLYIGPCDSSAPAHICCEFKICYIICIIAVLYGIWCYILDLVIQAHLLISVVSSKSAILYASLLCCMEYDVIYWTLWFKRTCSYLLWVQNLLYYMHHCCAVWNMMLYIGPCDSSAPAHICCEFKICYIICIIAVLYGIWCYILDLVIQAHLLISVVSSKSAILYVSLLCCMEYDVIYWTLWFKRTCSYLLWVQNLLYYMHHCCAVWNMMLYIGPCDLSAPAHICCEFKICYIICIIAVLYGIWCYILDLVIQAHLLISVVSSKSAILYASLLCCMEYDVIYWTLWFKRTCSYLLWVQNLLYYMHHCCAVWNMMLYIGPCDSSAPAHICCEFKICNIICIIAVLYGIWCYILDLVIQAHLLISVVSSKSAILYASLLCCMEYDVIYWTLWFKRTCSYLLWVQNLLYYMHHYCAVWNMMLYIGPCDLSAPAHICCEFKICYIICIIAVLYGIWCYILDLVIIRLNSLAPGKFDYSLKWVNFKLISMLNISSIFCEIGECHNTSLIISEHWFR